MGHLRRSTCCCLTTGCVVAIANMQTLLPSMRRRLCRHRDCDCRPWRLSPSSLVVKLVLSSSSSSSSTSTSIAIVIVIVVVSSRAIAIIVDFVACRVVAIVMVMLFLKCLCVHFHAKNMVNA
jgi:hypothetical protein